MGFKKKAVALQPGATAKDAGDVRPAFPHATERMKTCPVRGGALDGETADRKDTGGDSENGEVSDHARPPTIQDGDGHPEKRKGRIPATLLHTYPLAWGNGVPLSGDPFLASPIPVDDSEAVEDAGTRLALGALTSGA